MLTSSITLYDNRATPRRYHLMHGDRRRSYPLHAPESADNPSQRFRQNTQVLHGLPPYGKRTRDGWSRGSIVTARSGRTVISSPQSARSAPKHSKTLHRRPGKRTDPDILQHGFQSRKPKLAGFCATQSIKSRLPQPTCTPVVPMRASQYRLTIISATAQRNLIEFLAKTEGRRWPRSQ